jgi:hypothetical protein
VADSQSSQPSDKIALYFGALCEPIAKQLSEQGHVVTKKNGRILQEFADSITMLKLHGFLTEAETHRARQRFLKRISKGLHV